jgi:hypothetical protein
MRPVRRQLRLDAISRDDALLDSVGPAGRRPEDDALGQALYMWRCDVEADPFPAAPRRGVVTRFRGRASRGLAMGAVASAIGLASVGGVAAAATQAGPDSALWPITRVVAADRVQSREAAFHARSSLDRASTAAAQDRRDAAERYLTEAEQDTVWVRGDDGGPELRDEAARLRLRLLSPTPGTPSASPSGTPSVSPTPSGQPTPDPSRPGPTPGETTAPPPTTGPTTTGPTGAPSATPAPRRAEPRTTPSPRRTLVPRKTTVPREPAQPGLSDQARALLRLLVSPSPRP